MKTSQRKAVSPVIATVILVAVAITVSVGVSYWMSGISSQYTQFEKIEIQTGYAQTSNDGANPPVVTGWVITLTIKNSGSAPSTITHVFVNDIPIVTSPTQYAKTALGGAGVICTDVPTTGLTLEAGESDEILVWISAGGGSTLSAGTTVNIKLHSAGGMDYIKLIKLV